MATEIRVPTLGESINEATVGKWFKKVGDQVAVDEPLVELETDKVTLEVPAPAAGVIEAIDVDDGSTVEPGAILGRINAGAVAKTAAATAAGPQVKPESEKPAVAAAETERAPAASALSPAVRKIAEDKSLDVAAIDGTGKDGRLTKGDVLAALERGAAGNSAPNAAHPPSSSGEAPREERVGMTRLRQTIARRLKEAQDTAAMLSTFNEVDMSAVMEMRAAYRDLFERKHGVKLGFMGFFVKACVQALEELPEVNAEIDRTDIVYKNYYHIGIAVGTDRGLVVPVVRDADQLSLAGIEKTIGELGTRARNGELSIADMQGGTFTITNGGVYGSLMSTPILNAPQSGILGMHKIQDRPVAIDGKIEIRPMMYLALSYDHRIVDGKDAVTFLVRVKECLEDPRRLVLDL